MKSVILKELVLTNFKGISSFVLNANGQNVRVLGDNATGKTTAFDGFLYLLFDKDSNNDSKFAIQTLTVAGEKVHNLEHTVEGTLLVNGVPVKLKKVYKEKWTRKRGQSKAEFSGYTTDHFVDDVPMAKKDYVKKVEEIVEEETFKLLTSPTYFNEQLKDGWKKRRNILLEVCGDISDEEVISADERLKKLNDVLSGKSIDDMKKIIASGRKRINEELEMIPVRIDEITKMIPDVTADIGVLKAQVADLEKQIDDFKNQRYNVLNGAAIKDKENELKDLEAQLRDYERTFAADSILEVQKLDVKVQELLGNIQIIKAEIRTNEVEKDAAERDIKAFTERISSNEVKMQNLRDLFALLKQEKFEYSDACECSLCKQPLPEEQLKVNREEALAQFNEHISSRAASIKSDGLKLSEENKQLQAQINAINEKLASTVLVKADELSEKLSAAEKALATHQEKLAYAKATVPDAKLSDGWHAISGKINVVQAAISEMKVNAASIIDDIDANIAQLEQQRKDLNAELNKFDYAEQQQNRINELEVQQQKLAAEFEELEGNLFLIEEFTRKKVSMLEERINSKFKYARFKLFEEQVNGGLNEVCETLYNGVPYGSGLNNAAKINVGLDIINTLSAHYGIQAPIFVDNAEAVTKFIDVNTQLISLVVSEKDKVLRIEHDSVDLKEAI